MKHSKKRFLGLAVGSVIIFIAWFIWDGFIKDKTPQFFPINEQQGEYSIVKSWDGGIFMVKYKGPNSFSYISKDNDGSISVIVGKTDYDLNQYLEKKVLLTKGDFKGGFTKQCVANICRDIGGPYVAVIIEEMEEIRETGPRGKIVDYEAVESDTLQGIAEKFSISTKTIKWANKLRNETVIPGQILKILPVTGVAHTVIAGDTLENIAKKYHVNVQKIIDFPYNPFSDEKYTMTIGQIIIVPDGIIK